MLKPYPTTVGMHAPISHKENFFFVDGSARTFNWEFLVEFFSVLSGQTYVPTTVVQDKLNKYPPAAMLFDQVSDECHRHPVLHASLHCTLFGVVCPHALICVPGHHVGVFSRFPSRAAVTIPCPKLEKRRNTPQSSVLSAQLYTVIRYIDDRKCTAVAHLKSLILTIFT